MRHRLLVVIVLTLALVAAACSDGGSSADVDENSTADEGEGGEAGNDADDPSGDDVSVDDAPSSDDPPADPPDSVELTASAPGITEDTIRIGLAIPDLSAFSNGGDVIARYRVAGEAVNAAGGVIGRQLEFVVEEWDSLDSSGLDAACIALTQDVEVFAILTRQPAALGDASCFSALGETITVSSSGIEAAWIDNSGGRLFGTLTDAQTSVLGGLELLVDELAVAKVAVNGSGDDPDRADELADRLGDLGIDVVATTLSTIQYNTDPAASLAEQDRFSEVWNSNGATHVLAIGAAATGAAEAIENNALADEITLITGTIGLRTLGAVGTDLSAISMIGISAEDQFTVGEEGRYRTDVCLQRIEDELGEVIDYDVEPGEVNNLPSALQACAAFDFLVAGLEAAGPNPSQEDFLAVVAAGLDFDMTGAATARADTDSAYLNRGAGEIYDWDGSEFTPRA